MAQILFASNSSFLRILSHLVIFELKKVSHFGKTHVINISRRKMNGSNFESSQNQMLTSVLVSFDNFLSHLPIPPVPYSLCIKKPELTPDSSENVRGTLIQVLGTIMCCAVLFAFWLMCFSCKVRRRRMQQFEDLKIDNLYHDDLPIIINHDRRPSMSSTSTWTTYQHQRNRFIDRELKSV